MAANSSVAVATKYRVYTVFEEIDGIPDGPATQREKTLLIKRLEQAVSSAGGEQTARTNTAIMSCCLALVGGRFAPVQADAAKAAAKIGEAHRDLFWTFFMTAVRFARSSREYI